MRNAKNHRILISGLGSIGRRHLANIEGLGYRDIAFHRSGKSTIDTPLPEYPVYRDLDRAISDFHPDVVFVCGPSHSHLDVALKAAASGTHLFIEKPLSHTLENVAKLNKITADHDSRVMVGYMMRFHPLLIEIRDRIARGQVGDLIHVRSQWGEYVPGWHPWEDYRETYAARRALGGGPALTLSHEIDLALWFLGGTGTPPVTVRGLSNTHSGLEVDTEHGIDILIGGPGGTTANLHLDFYQRPPARSAEFVGTEGRIIFDYYSSRIEVFSPEKPEPVEIIDISDSFERNNMFISEIEHFFECIADGATPVPGLAEGKAALNVALQAIATES
ncbi:MAG: Gfo/Idh/MocA family oxidoreductase [Dehalococcoidia bacterium]|nr:Gfo/Idh/MocA family oxidoreductase [Dehalococcoidia bacterium]